MEDKEPKPSCLCLKLTEERLSSRRGQSASLQSSMTTRLIEDVFRLKEEKLMEELDKNAFFSEEMDSGLFSSWVLASPVNSNQSKFEDILQCC